MQDRFKFRVWETVSKQMHYNDFTVTATGYIAALKPLFRPDGTPYNDEFVFNQRELDFDKDNVLMQCTGKRDCNENLIYENDIVRLTAKNGMKFDYLVKYKNYQFILEYINGKLKGTKARDFYKEYAQTRSLYEHGYKVIGNFYENKELLDE